MARIRTIKPEFFTSLTVADLTPEQRLTFIGLWTHVDDDGRCVDDPRLIKAAVWPLDDRTSADIETDLKTLDAAGLILRYTVQRRRYIAVRTWGEHQKINRPTRSRFPAPEDGTPTPPSSGERHSGHSVSPHGAVTEPSNADKNGAREGSGTAQSAAFRGEMTTSAAEQASIRPDSDSRNHLTSELAGLTESSLRTHTCLSEGSPPERKGTGNREGKGTPLPPAPHQPHADDSEGPSEKTRSELMTEEWWAHFGKRMAQTKRSVRQAIADALTNGVDPAELHAALGRLGETSKPVTGGTLQFALAEIRRPAPGAEVIPFASRQQQASDDMFDRAMARAEARMQQESS